MNPSRPETVHIEPLPEHAARELAHAKRLLETPRLVARLSDLVGSPAERLLEKLDDSKRQRVLRVTEEALTQVMDMALRTMDPGARVESKSKLHLAAASATGMAGGAFGWAALAVELPLSTGIILRSIADIARSEGERLDDPATRMECLTVLAFGGTTRHDDGAETGYFAARAALAGAVAGAVRHVEQFGVGAKGAPAIVRLIALIAERFGVQVSAKVAATAVPIVGALGGGALNSLFIDHFQRAARGHFVVRRLEREFGEERVRAAYVCLQPDE